MVVAVSPMFQRRNWCLAEGCSSSSFGSPDSSFLDISLAPFPAIRLVGKADFQLLKTRAESGRYGIAFQIHFPSFGIPHSHWKEESTAGENSIGGSARGQEFWDGAGGVGGKSMIVLRKPTLTAALSLLAGCVLGVLLIVSPNCGSLGEIVAETSGAGARPVVTRSLGAGVVVRMFLEASYLA